MKLQALMCTAFMAVGSMTAMAGTTLLSPNPAVTQEVDQIDKITLKWDTEDAGIDYGTAYILDSSNQKVCDMTSDFDWDDLAIIYITAKTTVTTAGDYTVVIPANFSETLDNDEIRLNYHVAGVAVSVSPIPTAVKPAPGNVTFSADTPFNDLRFEFGNPVYCNFDAVKLTGANGELPLNWRKCSNADDAGAMWEYFKDLPFITADGFNDGTLPSGTYTITFPVGSLGTAAGPSGVTNENALTYTWNYDANKAVADPTPLEILSAELVKVVDNGNGYDYEKIMDFTDGVALPDMTTENALLFTLNHGAKAGYISYTLYDGNDEIWLLGRLDKISDGRAIYRPVFTNKFDAGVNYRFEIRTYSEENNQLRVEYGDGVSVTFTGTNEAYQYSPYTFVAASPDPDRAVIKSLDDRTITLVYSGPVKVTDKSCCLLGVTATMPFEKIEPKTQRAEYDAVWFLTVPEYILKSMVGVNMSVFAVDEEGRAVKGNAGTELNSWNEFAYELAYFQPRIVLTENSVRLPEIEKIRISAEKRDGTEKGINCSWIAYPELRDNDGKKVAGIIDNYDKEYGTPYVIIRESAGSEPEPLELEFCLDQKITTPGKYTLHFPKYCFALGSQFDGESSVEQDFDLWVAPHHNLTYTVDNHTIDLPAVMSGRTATVSVTPAEDWKVGAVKFNGEDVTSDYADGKYTTPAVTQDSNVAVEFAFDGALVEPSGIDDVVTDFNLRVWTENGQIHVAGLAEGMALNVYTAGGAAVAAMTAGQEDHLVVTVPAGTYVLTISNGEKRQAVKVTL